MDSKQSSTETVRFFYNGIKVGTGPLFKGHWSLIEAWERHGKSIPTHIVMYRRGYEDMPRAVYEAFPVENNTDLHTDYFETDRVRILTTHPLFREAAAAMAKDLERTIARLEKRGYADVARFRNELAKLNAVVASLGAEAA